ncbi:hypothetical protein PHMEG_00012433 [Phytophthora megakarya]|uniref:Uncharacterized protein n=1 Tax=Phytophthora megakarya TaxID=4795 RepID=A0A225WA60_9STRA|nr:hypothetical protein PHMEG_00012433 [Phytophthora megakarya]
MKEYSLRREIAANVAGWVSHPQENHHQDFRREICEVKEEASWGRFIFEFLGFRTIEPGVIFEFLIFGTLDLGHIGLIQITLGQISQLAELVVGDLEIHHPALPFLKFQANHLKIIDRITINKLPIPILGSLGKLLEGSIAIGDDLSGLRGRVQDLLTRDHGAPELGEWRFQGTNTLLVRLRVGETGGDSVVAGGSGGEFRPRVVGLTLQTADLPLQVPDPVSGLSSLQVQTITIGLGVVKIITGGNRVTIEVVPFGALLKNLGAEIFGIVTYVLVDLQIEAISREVALAEFTFQSGQPPISIGGVRFLTVTTADFGDVDDVYPFRPQERVRRDATVSIFITSHVNTKATHEAAGDGYGGHNFSEEEGDTVAVVTRWAFTKIWNMDLNIRGQVLQEMRYLLSHVSGTILSCVRETIDWPT